MTEVQQKPMVAGLVGTVLVWILIFLFFYFSALLFAPKPYKTIKIRLDAPQKVENGKLKTENSVQKAQANPTKGEVSPSASSKESATPSAGESKANPAPATPPKSSPRQNKPAQSPSQSKPAASKPSPSKAAAPKSAPSKTVEKPKMVEQTLQKSMEELIAEQQQKKKAPKKKSDEEMWAELDAQDGNPSVTPVLQKQVPPSSPYSPFSKETAAQVESKGTSAIVQSDNEKKVTGEVDSKTKDSLEGIRSATFVSTSGGVSSSVTANTGSSSDGKVSIAMSDGTQRILLEPAEPKILLSEQASALIDSTKRLTVSFTVTASGNVPVTSVKISPDILPSLVSMEIREQISRWRFQAASYDGSAKFDYTIQKQ